MQRQRTRPSVLTQLVDLTLIQLSNWRWSWRGTLMTGMIAPVFSIIALSIFARDRGVEALEYVLTGNIVLSLMFENQNKICNNFAYMRSSGTLSYYATLPIRPRTLMLASLVSFFLLSLPALTMTVLFGTMLLQVPLTPHPLLLLIVPLCALPLAGIGAVIGSVARTPEEANSLSLLTTFVLMAMGPVIFPAEALPGYVSQIGRLSPATYAASALRQGLLGPVTPTILLDLGILAVLSLVILWFVDRRLAWRQP